MRIGLITPGFSASEEDWCVPALLDLVRVLAEHDEVTVFALRYPHRQNRYAVYGAEVWPTGGAQRAGLARLPILLRTLARILRQGRRRRFDVLHALWAHEPGLLAVLAGRWLKVPVAVSILGGELANLPDLDYGGERSRANRWLVARALGGADRVTVGSRWLGRCLEGQVPAAKLRRQPLGVDGDRFRPGSPGSAAPPLAGDPKLLQVASLSPVKDHKTLLAAFAIVAGRYPGAHLHLVGEGELEGPVRAQAAELGLAERVVLHGAVDHGSLVDFYRQADLYVQSSRFESQGMAVLEATFCGCPVVGTGVGVAPELSATVGSATPGDAADLARLMDAVLGDSARRERLIRAQAEAAREFELRAVVDRLRQHYRRLGVVSK